MNRPAFGLTFVIATSATYFVLYCGSAVAVLANQPWLPDPLGDGYSGLVRLGAVSAIAGLFIAAFRTGLRD